MIHADIDPDVTMMTPYSSISPHSRRSPTPLADGGGTPLCPCISASALLHCTLFELTPERRKSLPALISFSFDSILVIDFFFIYKSGWTFFFFFLLPLTSLLFFVPLALIIMDI